MTNSLTAKKDLTTQELSLLDGEYQKQKKGSTPLWLLWLFTGGFGGHRYYLGDFGRAILHTLVFILALIAGISAAASAETDVEILFYAPLAVPFFLSFPALWALIDAFFIGRRLAIKNAAIEAKIINQIKDMRVLNHPTDRATP